MSFENIDWDDIRAKLPTEKTDEEKARRKKMFAEIDNGNGKVSLAEVDKGVRDVLKLDEIFDSKPAIMKAYQIAKEIGASGNDAYIEFNEFRMFLVNLRKYFEYYVAFRRVDTSSDKRIELIEFTNAIGQLEDWVGKIDDPESEFKSIDKNGGGYILFDEFCDWAMKKDLDLDDDDD
ncbi:flagellar calcium-binding protein-like [Convolutriloba macropyga]|uniref:flagellar calcium-binding protein-like n=1 Tax=Convolutriloba macropyga TaxID=536237 RepID=UPI003F5269B5